MLFYQFLVDFFLSRSIANQVKTFAKNGRSVFWEIKILAEKILDGDPFAHIQRASPGRKDGGLPPGLPRQGGYLLTKI